MKLEDKILEVELNYYLLKRYQEWEENEEILTFREYLRIPSVHPDIDYSE